MPTFTINCPSCGNELTNCKVLFNAYSVKHQNDIPDDHKAVLTRLPRLNRKELIEDLRLPTCCVAELLTRVDRTLLLYGCNYVE